MRIPRINVDTASREKLVEHILLLEGFVADMRPDDSEWEAIRRTFGLTRQEALVVQQLLTGGLHTYERLTNVAARWKPDIQVRTLCRIVHTARHKLSAFGIEIENTFGTGYRLPAESLAKARDLMTRATAA